MPLKPKPASITPLRSPEPNKPSPSSYEPLRASARLWQKQGKRQEAHDLLAPVYHWFTEASTRLTSRCQGALDVLGSSAMTLTISRTSHYAPPTPRTVSYRALKRRFAIDDDYIEDLKEEIIHAQRLATDRMREFSSGTGDNKGTTATATPPAQLIQQPPPQLDQSPQIALRQRHLTHPRLNADSSRYVL